MWEYVKTHNSLYYFSTCLLFRFFHVRVARKKKLWKNRLRGGSGQGMGVGVCEVIPSRKIFFFTYVHEYIITFPFSDWWHFDLMGDTLYKSKWFLSLKTFTRGFWGSLSTNVMSKKVSNVKMDDSKWRIERIKNGIRLRKPVFGSFWIAEYEYLVKKIKFLFSS